MTSAAEEFTIALARASKRGFRVLQRVPKDEREDVIAMTIAWCWEHRAEFKPHEITLEEWFARKLRNFAFTAQRTALREAARRSYKTLEELEESVNRSSKRPVSDTIRFGSSHIDHEVEAMLRGPRIGMRDCPPCWRCLYFEGWTPNAKRYKPPGFRNPEVQTATRETEARKIKIGNGERL